MSRRLILETRSSVIAAFAIIFAIFLTLMLSASANSPYVVGAGLDVNHAKTKGDVVSLAYAVTDIQPNDGVMTVVATPELSGRFGSILGSGSFVQTKLDFVFDAYTGQSFWQRDISEIAGGMEVVLKLEGDQRTYPFDGYTAELISTAIESTYENPTETGLYIRDARELVPGFQIESAQFAASLDKGSPAAEQAEIIKLEQEIGISGVRWQVSRSLDIVLTVGLLGLLVVMGAGVSVMITLSIIRGKRPPSMNALSWNAALLFAMFSVRTQLPGSPPNGILFDLWIFYPVILLLVMLIGITVISWIMRDDWDVSNPVSAILGRRADKK